MTCTCVNTKYIRNFSSRWFDISSHPHYNYNNERDGASNYRHLDCLLNCLFRRRKHQSSASLAFVRGIRLWPVDSPHKRASNAEMFSFNYVIMQPAFWLLEDMTCACRIIRLVCYPTLSPQGIYLHDKPPRAAEGMGNGKNGMGQKGQDLGDRLCT